MTGPLHGDLKDLIDLWRLPWPSKQLTEHRSCLISCLPGCYRQETTALNPEGTESLSLPWPASKVRPILLFFRVCQLESRFWRMRRHAGCFFFVFLSVGPGRASRRVCACTRSTSCILGGSLQDLAHAQKFHRGTWRGLQRVFAHARAVQILPPPLGVDWGWE